jgi:hypothetical protein
MTDSDSEISIIIPNWNGAAWLPDCLAGLAAQRGPRFETVLVDNGSNDGSPDLAVRLLPGLRVIRLDRNRGFAAAVNEGIRQTCAPLVALINTDTIPEPDWLTCLAKGLAAAGPACGSAASLMLDLAHPETVENAGDLLTWQGLALKRGHGEPAARYSEPAPILSACAGAALYRRTMLEATGGFDESFFAYLEDVDLGLRARLFGFGCVYVPGARIRHQGHGSRLARGRYARLIARNRLLLLYKNIPTALLRRHAPALLAGTLLLLVAHRRPLDTLAGLLDAWRALPAARAQRQVIREHTRLTAPEIERLLVKRPPP